jgi:WD40 repeat protein
MASSSTQPGTTENNSILTPVMTLDGHKPSIIFLPDGKHHEYQGVSCLSYFPDGKQIISGSRDRTIRRWDLREGKEIVEDLEVCENRIRAVGVSSNGRWVVTAGGSGELKVSEVETGIVRTFFDEGHFVWITCIDVSLDSTLVAGGSIDSKVRIWSLDTGKLVAGPFKCSGDYGPAPGDLALRFSKDSRKLAVLSYLEQRLQVWDVQAQKLDVQRYTLNNAVSILPVFWTTKDKSIVAAFSFTDSDGWTTTIYEFDASTLKTIGAPFKTTSPIDGLTLSSDCILLASTCHDHTIKLWAFESRELLASFNITSRAFTLVLSPDSRQLAYTSRDETKIYVCNIPANILASIGLAEEPQPSVCTARIYPSFIC